MTNNTYNFLTYGNYREDCEIPCIEIKLGEEVVGYLAPFRGYRFQVMGDINGQGDYGSSPVIGLGHVLDINFPEKHDWKHRSNYDDETIIEVLLEGQAAIALNEFVNIRTHLTKIPHVMAKVKYEDKSFAEFLKSTVKWLRNN